ncbi:MAG TPA: AI-2E family transporter [Hyphomicrobiales bacterium]|nr:AI-2E family transporter [Hyphomicrobiales bacterium]
MNGAAEPGHGDRDAARAKENGADAEEEHPEEHQEGHVRWISSRSTIAVLVAVVVFLYLIRQILLPFVIAGWIAYASTPLVHLIERRAHIPRWVAAILVFAVLALAASGIGVLSAPSVIREGTRIVTDFHGMMARAAHELVGSGTIKLFDQELTADQLADKIVTAARGLVTENGRALLLATWGFSAIFGVFLTAVILFYFMVGGPTLGRGLLRLVPPWQRPLVDEMWERTNPVLRRYFIGIAIVVAYAMIASYIGLGLVLHIGHAGLLAVVTGLLEMIPIIGPAASALVAGLVALHNATSIWNIVGYIIYAALLRLSIDQMLGPLVLGKAARIHPVLVIFCFLSGGLLFGISGVIMSVPVALTIRIVLGTLYDEPLPGIDPDPVPAREEER